MTLRRVARVGFAGLVSSVAILGTAAGPVSAEPVFVNEFHYDNVGADQDKGIELAGPAGTDLSAHSIELYNGYNRTRYATVPLSGSLPDQENGYGTRFFAIPGLQNGAPDGLALVGPHGVVEALGYEGTFTAVDGAAAGMSLADIGHFEAPSTPIGRSIQLQGTGRSSTDFGRGDPVDATLGRINVRQHFLAPRPGGRSSPVEPSPPGGCVATRYSGFFIPSASIRVNDSVAFFHATTLSGGQVALRTVASRDAVDRVSYRLDGRMLSRKPDATVDTAALSRPGTHTLTITVAGHDRRTTVARRFRFRRYPTLCRVKRVVGRIKAAHATVDGTRVTVQAFVPPTIKGGAKLRFVVSASHASRVRRARFFLNGHELPGQHARSAGITASQLDPGGKQSLAVRLTPHHGSPVTIPVRFRTRVTTLEPISRAGD